MGTEKRLYRSVLERLDKLIEDGEYPPGGRLPPERELAERFSVSRPTVREAIIALEALERVEVKTGSGVYVLESPKRRNGIDTNVSAFELTEARALIEGEAAALAAAMISDEQLDELESTLHEMADESEDGKLISELADQKFHRIISEATRNSMMISIFDNLWHVRDNAPDVHAAYQAICEIDPQSRVDEHREIFDALKKRDPKAAREAMHGHFARILNNLIVASEKAQVEEIRRKTKESRQRFSLNHLATGAS
ncbi:MAG: FadR/GntR family transcriptional regulator [Pseudomonadota bacterium]